MTTNPNAATAKIKDQGFQVNWNLLLSVPRGDQSRRINRTFSPPPDNIIWPLAPCIRAVCKPGPSESLKVSEVGRTDVRPKTSSTWHHRIIGLSSPSEKVVYVRCFTAWVERPQPDGAHSACASVFWCQQKEVSHKRKSQGRVTNVTLCPPDQGRRRPPLCAPICCLTKERNYRPTKFLRSSLRYSTEGANDIISRWT